MQLVLASPETKLRVKDGLFEVTWLDERKITQRAQHAPASLRSVWLSDGASVTVAALRLAMQNDLDVVICDRHGDPEGRLWPIAPGTTTRIQKAQALASISPGALEWPRRWAIQKTRSQAALLEKLARKRGEEARKIVKKPLSTLANAENALHKLDLTHPAAPADADISATLRGLEGAGSKAFFEAVSALLPDQYQFAARSRRPAKDAFNAYLNYGLAVLYGKTERAIVQAGLNPYLGFLHRDGYRRKSLVFDFIEPYRAGVVEALFGLFSQKIIAPNADYTVRPDGSVLLTKEGKVKLMTRLNKYYEKKTEWEGLSMTRERALEKAAQQFAQSLDAAFAQPGEQEESLPSESDLSTL